MTAKSVILRELATRDVDDAISYYLREHADGAALDLVDRLQEASEHIGRCPGTGSSRYAHELDIPGLRTWPLKGFPYLIFYIDRADRVDVLRVLHSHRDIPTLMRDPQR